MRGRSHFLHLLCSVGHPAFCAAMQVTLLEYNDDLDFIREYNLNRKPLELDLLILRKINNIAIREKIGHIFRKHNLFEYKSPEDQLNIDVLFKTVGYGCLYKSYGKKTDEIKADEVTLSLLRHHRPVRLLDRLKNAGQLKQYADGIYYVKGFIFPTQIIVAGDLAPEDRPYLNYLTDDLNKEQAKELVCRAERETSHLGRELVDALLHVFVRSNNEVFETGKKEDSRMCEALRELMASEIAEETAKATAEGRAKGLAEGLTEGRAEGRNSAINNLSDTLMEKDPSLTREAAVAQAREWLKIS